MIQIGAMFWFEAILNVQEKNFSVKFGTINFNNRIGRRHREAVAEQMNLKIPEVEPRGYAT